MAPLQVLASTLSAEQTGRLYKALIETKLATSVSASADALCEPGRDGRHASRPGRTSRSTRSARSCSRCSTSLGQQTFTDEEVDRAKKAFARNFDLMLNDSARVGLRLSESAAQGDWRLMFLHRDRMAKVTPADVQRVAGHYLKPSNRTVGVFIPTKAAGPGDGSADAGRGGAAQGLQGHARRSPQGEAFEATYANIEAHTQRSKLPVGMKLALLPKQTRGNRVNATLTFHYGSEADLTGKEAAASLLALDAHARHDAAHAAADSGPPGRAESPGARRRGRRRRAARYVRLARGGPGTLDVSIETTRENLPAVLDLVGEILRQPAFPAGRVRDPAAGDAGRPRAADVGAAWCWRRTSCSDG